jgi:predicted amidohydrolase YtcJ
MADLVVTRADLGGGRVVDIRVSGGRIEAVGPAVQVTVADRVLDAAGGAVIPGLHDHHVHLLATAAARQSVELGPATLSGRGQLAAALREADGRLPAGAWLRGVGYHDTGPGPIDRWVLDEFVGHRPVKIQHRSGHRWTLNSAALAAVVPLAPEHPGIERDPSGTPTGHLFDMDRVIERAGGREPPCLGALSERAARLGVTGFTDATPAQDGDALAALGEARAAGALVQRTTVMTGPGGDGGCPDGLILGPVKLMLADTELPGLEDLAASVAAAHHAGRPVAVHCVTRTQLVLTLAALESAGPFNGDRIEHGALVPAELVAALRRLGVTVVTNPGFVFDRADDYLAEVDRREHGDLYRCGSLVAAGVAVAAGTDSPFGPDDPWVVIRAAVDRRSRTGVLLGPEERLEPRRALSLLLGPGSAPGSPRRVALGEPADLCVLSTPLEEALAELDADNVAATVVAGEVVADNR